MTTIFDRELTGYRFAETNVGDTLQAIALRELGDASRWPELIAYNHLVPPFIVDDPAVAGPGVLVTGSSIVVPAPGRASPIPDPDQVLGTDIQLDGRGMLVTDGQDFVPISGRANLSQAIRNRVGTPRGDLMFHPGYGGDVRRLIGAVNGPTKGLVAASSTRTTVEQDPRVVRVTSAVAQVSGDTINVAVEAETIAGRAVHSTRVTA